MHLSKFTSLITLLVTPILTSAATGISPSDIRAVHEVRRALEADGINNTALDKRACPYPSCDVCLTKFTQCQNCNRDGDCLHCCLSWYVLQLARWIGYLVR